MKAYTDCVTNADEAVAFLRWCCETVGLGFHPDTAFGDYADDAGRCPFTEAEADELDRLMWAAFRHLSDPYSVCLSMEPFSSAVGMCK